MSLSAVATEEEAAASAVAVSEAEDTAAAVSEAVDTVGYHFALYWSLFPMTAVLVSPV